MADSSVATESPADVTVDPWDLVNDGSTLLKLKREDFDPLVAEYVGAVRDARDAQRIGASKIRVAASRQMALRLAIDFNGHPDWKAASMLYREVVANSQENALYADPKEKQRVQGAIRTEIDRNHREAAITDYVLRTGSHGVKAGDLKWTPSVNDIPSVVAQFDTGDAKQMALRTAIAAEYAAAGLTVPVKFGGEKPGTGGGPGKADPANPAASLKAAAADVAKVSPIEAATAIRDCLVAFSLKARSTGEPWAGAHDAEVVKVLAECGIVSRHTAKLLSGADLTDSELAALNATTGFGK